MLVAAFLDRRRAVMVAVVVAALVSVVIGLEFHTQGVARTTLRATTGSNRATAPTCGPPTCVHYPASVPTSTSPPEQPSFPANAWVKVSPSTGLTDGEVVTVTAGGFTSYLGFSGTLTECNTAQGQPRAGDQPGWVSCTAPVSVTLTPSGHLQLGTTFRVASGVTGPPVPGQDGDYNDGAADARNYPCPPTGPQIAAGAQCVVMLVAQNAFPQTPITFTLATSPVPPPTTLPPTLGVPVECNTYLAAATTFAAAWSSSRPATPMSSLPCTDSATGPNADPARYFPAALTGVVTCFKDPPFINCMQPTVDGVLGMQLMADPNEHGAFYVFDGSLEPSSAACPTFPAIAEQLISAWEAGELATLRWACSTIGAVTTLEQLPPPPVGTQGTCSDNFTVDAEPGDSWTCVVPSDNRSVSVIGGDVVPQPPQITNIMT